MIHLLAQPPNGRLSGGFLANEYLTTGRDIVLDQISSASGLSGFALRTGEPVLVDSIWLYDETAEGLLLRMSDVRPVLLLAHSLPSLLPGPTVGARRIALARERRILDHIAGAIAPSSFMRQALIRRGMAPRDVRVVPLAPVCDGRGEIAVQTSRPEDEIEILTVANWTRAKGIELLAASLALIPDLSWRWRIAGALPDTDAGASSPDDPMVRLRSILGPEVADRVVHCGPLRPASLFGMYRSADLFVLLSQIESYGIAFAEAISHGVPVIGLKTGAVAEVVGDAGTLLPAGSDPHQIAGTIRAAILPGELDRLRRRAVARSSTFPTAEEVAAGVVSSTLDIVAGRTHR